jgi:hypothetical protein
VAFYDCTRLTNFTIPNSITSIGDYTFYQCATLTSVTIPNSVTNIGDFAISDCTSLTSVTIPNSVTSIGYGAFSGSSLTNVTIPDSVTTIGGFPFIGCWNLDAISVDSSNQNYGSIGGVLFDKRQTTLIQYPDAKAASYTIPNTVTTIGDHAFSDCTSLTSVSIPNSVTVIGNGAFELCTNLPSIMIPDSVTSIGNGAFSDCTSLTGVTIPNSVISIGGRAFYRCTSLSNVTIPNSVTSIGGAAFALCTNLTGVYFQGNAPTLEEGFVFENDYHATAYYLPGITGWSTNYGGVPGALWTLPYPLILNKARGFGVQSNGFSFTVSWATNLSVVVEASSTLSNPIWSPLTTNNLVGGSFYFTDPQWTKYPSRFYRVRSP